MLNLKACPFCSEIDPDVKGNTQDGYYVICRKCKGRTGYYKTIQSAVKKWEGSDADYVFEKAAYAAGLESMKDKTDWHKNRKLIKYKYENGAA